MPTARQMIAPQFDDASAFCTRIRTDRHPAKVGGYIDKAGKIVNQPASSKPSDSLPRIWRASSKTGSGATSAKDGRFVITPQFEQAFDFSGGLAQVGIGDLRGYIDRRGKFVWNPSK
jgi:hypothetical protein